METMDEIGAVRERMLQERDVKRVIELVPCGPGRWRYLIETPFATWPRFVIGTTDAMCDDVKIEVKCGELWSANKSWMELYPERTEELV